MLEYGKQDISIADELFIDAVLRKVPRIGKIICTPVKWVNFILRSLLCNVSHSLTSLAAVATSIAASPGADIMIL